LQPNNNKPAIINLLSGSFLFSGLNNVELEKITDFAKIQHVPAKSTIFFKGDQGNSMFIVISGRLKVQNISEDGKTLILGFLEPNSSFGEIAVLDGKPRTATIISVEPSELLMIDRSSFLHFLEMFPGVSIKLMNVLCTMLRSTDEFLESVVFLNLPTRLAKMLRLLSLKYGIKTEHGIEFDIRISQSDLANLVGSSRESVNKQLKSWEDEGLIRHLGEGRLCVAEKLLHITE
jgi:CRP-like cAMP-binding protein